MPEATEKSRYFEFGPFRLDRQSRVLLRNGTIVPLTPKVFDTLAALVERPGEVITKEDLLRAVWPDSFVEESNLAQNVSVLRKALGDAAYIETAPKRGYRFASPFQTDLPAEAPEPAREPTALPPPEPQHSRLWALPAAALLLLLPGAFLLRNYFRPPVIQSLAVLPLKNLSGDPAQDHFAEGITELLTEQLSKRLPLRIVSRTSAARYRDSQRPLRSIGAELGVDALIEGSVVHSGDRVRVTVKLIDAASDRHLWGDTYDRDLADVLVFQKEIAQAVASEIHSGVVGAEDRPPSVVRESFEAYIRARYYWNLRTAQNLALAVSWFQKSIELDPANARAYAGLADCYNQLGTVMIGAGPPLETRKLASAAARRALEIDPNLAEAHAAMGYVHLYEWNWQRAQAELNRAIQLNPNYPSAHLWLAHFYSMHGRFKEALQEVLLARDLDPLSPIVETQHGWILIHAHRFDEALEVLRSVVKKFPDYQWASWQLGIGLAHNGDPQAAVEFLERAASRNRTHAILGFLGYAYGRAGRRGDALRVLGELRAASRNGYVSPHTLAFVYTGLNDRDKAFECLEQSFAERSNGIAWLAVTADFDQLRSDPRFDAYLRKLGLPRVVSP
jgi:TolB-like protein/DNA-binding winged helix-turn-helix (wHTH) protein/Tfp pilus assembly protein PilF